MRAQDAEGKNRVEVEEEGCQIKDNATHSQERIITLLQLALVSLSLSLSLRAHSLPTGEQREQSREQRIGTGSRPRDCTQKTVCSLQARKTV